MAQTPPSNPTSFDLPSRLLDQAGVLYREVILPHRYRAHAALAPDSPPEAMLAFALSAALAEPLSRGVLELHQRVYVRHPSYTADRYEIDIVLRQPATEAEAWIDPSSWSFKDRTEREYEYARRRQRELSGVCPHYLPYATSEVTADVWGCVLEVLERIGAPYAGFGSLGLPDELLPHLRELACVSVAAGKSVEPERANGVPPNHAGLLAEIRRKISDPLWDGNQVVERAAGSQHTHPRSNQRYTDVENDLLLQGARAGIPVPLLAQAVQRSTWAVSLQLERLGMSAA